MCYMFRQPTAIFREPHQYIKLVKSDTICSVTLHFIVPSHAVV